MIHYRCAACGHWMETTDHLIGVAVACRECGERTEVPARSAPNVPHATQPSQLGRAAAAGVTFPEDPAEEGPVEAGWHRLQDSATRLFPQTRHGYLLVSLGAFGVVLAVAAALGWWLTQS